MFGLSIFTFPLLPAISCVQSTGECPGNPTTEHVLSVGTPSVTVIEYGDIQCSHCRNFALNTYPTIETQYIDTGKIRWEFRHFPISTNHPNAQAAAEASECAHQQSAFFEYLDLAFQNQSNLTNAGLKSLATQLGLNRACFDPCLDGGGEINRVQQDYNAGVAQGVTSTPTFFINGSKVVGEKTVAQFSALLDEAIAAASP